MTFCAGILVLATTSCSDAGGLSDHGPLRAMDMNGAAVDIGNSQHSDTWSYGDFRLCVDRVPKSLVLKSIELDEGTKTAQVTGKYYIGSDSTDLAPSALPERYRRPGTVDVSRVAESDCPPAGEFLSIGVEVRSKEHWTTKGVRLLYEADGADYVAHWSFPMDVCAVADDQAPLCTEYLTPAPTG